MPRAWPPITGGTYYAVELTAAMLNTQGGARCNENAEVLDRSGNPIPHLYSAGELAASPPSSTRAAATLPSASSSARSPEKNAAAVKNDSARLHRR